MSSTYSTSLKIELIGTGDQSGQWGTTTNNNFGTSTGTPGILEQAICGVYTVTMTAGSDYTLTTGNGYSATSSYNESRYAVLIISGSQTGTNAVIVPAVSKTYIITNSLSGGATAYIKSSGGTALSIANGSTVLAYYNTTTSTFTQTTAAASTNATLALQATTAVQANLASRATQLGTNVVPYSALTTAISTTGALTSIVAAYNSASTTFPASGTLLIDSEQISYTSATANTTLGTLTFAGTLTRSVNGTTAATHSLNAPVYLQPTLNGSLTSSSTSVVVTNATNFPTAGIVLIDSEQILYTSNTAGTLGGLTRGYNNTTAAAHTSGVGVNLMQFTLVQSGNSLLVRSTNPAGTSSTTIGAFDSAGTYSGATNFGYHNRLINGDMFIDQRLTAITPVTTTAYTVDRWSLTQATTSTLTAGRNYTGGATINGPSDFPYYVGIKTTTSRTPGASDTYIISQAIESYNVDDLGWGASGASAVSLSFYVYASTAGTYSGAITNNSGRSYPFSYTVAATTWTRITIANIPGDTSGTWTSAIYVVFNLGSGTSKLGTANAWAGSTLYGVTGTASIVTSSSAQLLFTGVQLEKGSYVTPYDYRPVSTELSLCQRYFQSAGAYVAYDLLATGVAGSATTANIYIQPPVSLRVVPTVTTSDSTCFKTSTGVASPFTLGGVKYANNLSGPISIAITTTGQTAGVPVEISDDGAGTGYLWLDAEY